MRGRYFVGPRVTVEMLQSREQLSPQCLTSRFGPNRRFFLRAAASTLNFKPLMGIVPHRKEWSTILPTLTKCELNCWRLILE